MESNFNIVLKKGSSKRVESLTPLLITQSKDIFFSEIILLKVNKKLTGYTNQLKIR